MSEHAGAIDILMYHSISDGAGPTCIAPTIFRDHLAILADCGYAPVSPGALAAWMAGEASLPRRPVVLTFDDGFADFATAAFPALQAHNWTATVFLPTAHIGGTDAWEPHTPRCPARALLSWDTVAELARMGIEFGAHGVTHTDLTTLPPAVVREEIVQCKRRLEECTGCPVTSFAPPYGRTNTAVCTEIRQHYRVAVGTTLARTRRTSDMYNLPRIEMWYFRDPRRWRAYLEGRARGYFVVRQALRHVRALMAVGHRAASPRYH